MRILRLLKRRLKPAATMLALIALTGCWSTPVVHRLADADSWEIPVTPAKIVESSGLGVRSEEQKEDMPEMVITVPASDKPTKIEVRKVKRSIIEKALTNKPAHEVTSDNKAVTAAQPKKTVWWRWIAAGLVGLLFVVAVVAAIAARVANLSPWGAVLKLFKRG